MVRALAAILGFLLLPPAAVFAGGGAASDAVCVKNVSGRTHVFAAEAPGAGRKVAELEPGQRLCVNGADQGAEGVVSVYESRDSFEGCSRIVPVGRTEKMKEFVEFDRCFWSSNS